MFMQLFFFLKFSQRVTILQMVSNQEVTLKRPISMLRIAQKLYDRAYSDLRGAIDKFAELLYY